MIWLICVFFRFSLYKILCTSWIWVTTSYGREDFTIITSSIYFWISPHPGFWGPYNSNIGAFNFVSETVLLSVFYPTILSSYSLIHLSASIFLVLIHSSLFVILVIELFINVFVNSSMPCWTFLVSSSMPPFYFWDLVSSLLSLL